MVDHGFYFYQILAIFNKLKIMSEVVDEMEKYQTIYSFHKVVFYRGDSCLECFN